MFQTILDWLGFPKKEEYLPIEPTLHTEKSLHTEDSLSELTKSKLKTLGENEFNVTFKSDDRKIEIIMRILSAQAEK
jgi:hypothetical protein